MTLPAIPASFEWVQSPRGLVLKCRTLDSICTHMFTTRGVPLSSEDDWHLVASAVGARHAVTPVQVHGRNVAVLRRGLSPPAERPTCDVLVSNAPDVAVAVRAADCVPLLLVDSRSGAVGAVHAGWRGMAAGTIGAALEGLAREFATNPADIHAAIGPCIGPCCYEVGSELVDAFAAAGHARHLVDRWFEAPPAPRGSFSHLEGRGNRPRLRLDLPRAARDQLILAGVPEDRIYVSGLCTAMHLDVLTSYRAEKERAGRIAGVIRCK
jgi:purine-nucleoside/S-methyl-5'-thioadenosine phosphorylase / adenosine deaminase